MRSLPRLACLFAGLAACAVTAAQPAPPPVAPPPRLKRVSDAEVGRLIARVGSPSFAEREAATEELKRRPEAQAAVEKAQAAASNPEAARRLGAVSAVLKRDWARRRLARLPEYVNRRQFDRIVETMVACREHLTAEDDVHIRRFIKGVYDEATEGTPHAGTSGNRWIDFGTFAGSQRKVQPFEERRDTIIDRTARVIGLRTNAVASDWVGKPAPGEVAKDGYSRCVILCNGDVYGAYLSGGIVISSGRVEIWGLTSGAFVVSLGDVVTTSLDSSVAVCRGSCVYRSARGSVVREEDAKFFEGWRMFSAPDSGGHLVSALGVVLVTVVDAASPFGRAGVQAGDVLLRLDGTRVRSVAEAHQLLCRASVGAGSADVTLLRDGRLVSAVVGLESWEGS